MSTRGAGRAPRRAGQATLLAVGLAAFALGGCGEEDFTNEPARASAVIQVAARIDAKEVVVSPSRFGAGLVNFTVVNFSDEPATFTLSGPKDVATSEIQPGSPGDLKVELPEGSYEASAGDQATAKPDTVRVGPRRQSSQNELLLP
jgi:hypothetical protein